MNQPRTIKFKFNTRQYTARDVFLAEQLPIAIKDYPRMHYQELLEVLDAVWDENRNKNSPRCKPYEEDARQLNRGVKPMTSLRKAITWVRTLY